jgi:hypothetical protein
VLANGRWDLTLILLTSTKWWAPASDSKWRMGFNSEFKGLNIISVCILALHFLYVNLTFSWLYSFVICGLLDSTIFDTLSHKRDDFRGKRFTEHKLCVGFL